MKMKFKAISISLFVFALVSCSSGRKDTNQLGSHTTEGETKIMTKRQVTVTEKSDIPTLRVNEVKADINRMEEKHFVALGYPEDVAKNIVEYRDDHGAFKSIDDLRKVDG